MKRVLLVCAAAGVLGAIPALVLGYDFAFNDRRLLGALLGHDATIAACTPTLTAKLQDAGFEPHDLELGPTPEFSGAPGATRGLKGSFTFEDGAAGGRVDGIVACLVKGARVTVEFRTSSAPVRAG